MPQDVLTTERLHLRPRTLADLDACVALDLDPEVHRFIYGDCPPERGEHKAHLRGCIASGWPAVGGTWVVEWQHAPGFLGWCGLFPLEDTGPIEIGYRHVRSALEPGIATEAARAVLEHGFRALGFRSDRRGDSSGQPRVTAGARENRSEAPRLRVPFTNSRSASSS
jgi:RimJ/RimL family protein N-acetyltransferase